MARRKTADRMEGESTHSLELTEIEARRIEGALSDALRATKERPKPIDRVSAAMRVFQRAASGEFADTPQPVTPEVPESTDTEEGEAG